MTTQDLYLLSPELSMATLGVLLLLLDLVTKRKGYLVGIGLVGLTVPLVFSLSLWSDLGSELVSNNGILTDTLVVDAFSIFFKFLFIGTAAAVILISSDFVQRFKRFQMEYYALILFSLTGMMLLASTTELITIYISLELTALPLAALAAFNNDSRSSESGMKFLVLSGLSSAVLLYGMMLVYGFSGSTMLPDIAQQLGDINPSTTDPQFGSYALLLGIIMIVAGFGFKITSVPFQMWAPDVYEGSPTPVTAFLSVASKAAGFAVILRVFYVAFPLDGLSTDWSLIFAGLAAVTMTIGNLVAVSQTNIKRLLAYSTIAHAGYLMIGIAAVGAQTSGTADSLGVTGVLYYLGGYATMNLAAFAAVIAISNHIKSDDIDDFGGMGVRAPFWAAVLALAMASLTGLPPTVGFMVKIYIFGAALDAGLAWLALVGVLNSVVSAYYYLRIVKVLYLGSPVSNERVESGIPIRTVALATTTGILFFGLYPRPLIEIARTAADVLTKGA